MLIRPSTTADIAAAQAIYAHHVLTGSASFELDPPAMEEMARRRAALTDKGLPWLVAETGGIVRGYAYAGPYRTRPAYDWTLEDSIYIHADARGQGIGKALLTRLLDECTALGYRQMIAVIGDSANTGSICLHRSCGFNDAGILKAVGWKFGRWIDSVLMQKPLGDGDTQPIKD
ncbi:GNAT family N-acetyltransferase [Magnetospirillum sulfuroxidans]|uniref:N-acetyltransferase n=1 Tax=Magnetospirillum sulfuroxidans TaxID=611300 RepID=A0ABS5I939_9PROT|nr:GNAT family N-acetyltransferase [Magnetospirillum sulfuroxidans]MBR9970926.1 N-acetyltransferase [Magnetospirillum sulfuroxidans]